MGFFPLASFSDSSLLVYKNAIDFWVLVLYPSVLPNSLTMSSSFLVEPMGFSMYTIMLFVNNDNFTSSFPIGMPFISFSCLTAGVRTSSTMLNRHAGSEHPCLVPDLNGNTFSFCPLSMMLAISFSYMAFIMLRNAPSSPTLLSVFIINGCCTLSNAFSTSIDMIMWFLSFPLFIWCIMFIDLQILYCPYIPEINPTWSWHMIFLMYCWVWFANILLRILASEFIGNIGL